MALLLPECVLCLVWPLMARARRWPFAARKATLMRGVSSWAGPLPDAATSTEHPVHSNICQHCFA